MHMPNLLILFKDKQMIFLIQSTLRKRVGVTQDSRLPVESLSVHLPVFLSLHKQTGDQENQYPSDNKPEQFLVGGILRPVTRHGCNTRVGRGIERMPIRSEGSIV